MQKILLPEKKDWKSLITRPTAEKNSLSELVNTVFSDIKQNGDKAVLQYCKTFDKVKLRTLAVREDDIKNAESELSGELKAAIQLAKSNISKFHEAQNHPIEKIETTKGVFCWRQGNRKCGYLYSWRKCSPIFYRAHA
jgi:histidinol dehydrogenase